MQQRRRARPLGLGGAVAVCLVHVVLAQPSPRVRSAIIFVAEGLSQQAITAAATPALHRVRAQGTHFTHTHPVFPAHVMPNAAALATGHYPGDTGQFANRLFTGYPLFTRGAAGVLGPPPGTLVPDATSMMAMGDINAQYGGNFIREASLVAYARAYGLNTATIGTTGPAILQDVSEVSPVRGVIRPPVTIIIDSALGRTGAVPLNQLATALLRQAGLPLSPPADDPLPWFRDVAADAVLPAFAESDDPFVLVFWEHGRAAGDAERSLRRILDFLQRHPRVRDSTNLFVAAVPASEADPVPADLAVGLAQALQLPIYDPDHQVSAATRARFYAAQPPTSAAAVIGGAGRVGRPIDARVILAETSIHVPDHDETVVRSIVRYLAARGDVAGIFVHDRYGRVPGALPMSAVGLVGRATMPRPAVVVTFARGAGSHGERSGFMAASGPDFKPGVATRAPAGTVDVKPTLAHVMRFKVPSIGRLRGRVLVEALRGGPSSVRFTSGVSRSQPAAAGGASTVLMYERLGDQQYVVDVCFTVAQVCD